MKTAIYSNENLQSVLIRLPVSRDAAAASRRILLAMTKHLLGVLCWILGRHFVAFVDLIFVCLFVCYGEVLLGSVVVYVYVVGI